jgi:hypothetical protein
VRDARDFWPKWRSLSGGCDGESNGASSGKNPQIHSAPRKLRRINDKSIASDVQTGAILPACAEEKYSETLK